MPSNEERREAAQRKLERQVEFRATQARRRTIIISASAVLVVALVAAGITTTVLVTKHRNEYNASHIDCTYGKSADLVAQQQQVIAQAKSKLASQNATDRAASQKQIDYAEQQIGVVKTKNRDAPKPSHKQLKTGTANGVLNLSQGAVPFTINHATAPCNTGAFIKLIQSGFYNNTACDSEYATGTITALQCGDPTGTGLGGPSWASPDEVSYATSTFAPGPQSSDPSSQSVIYPRGTIAIVSQGQAANTGNSSFVIISKDSTLAPKFAVVGKVTDAGMKVIDAIAAKGFVAAPGSAPTNGPLTAGSPKETVTIKSGSVK